MWVKGSLDYRLAHIGDGPPIHLTPPHFTALLEAPPGPVEVVFSDVTRPGLQELAPPIVCPVVAPDPQDLNGLRERFALLAFGCFDPFRIHDDAVVVAPGDGTGRPGIKDEPYSRLWSIREAMKAVAAGALEDIPPSSLIVGAGDQVYVEAAHDQVAELGNRHPLSAWTVEAKPRPRVGLAEFEKLLSDTYRASWSFDGLDKTLANVPAVMIWDDHEIRDGWGSQGDEHVYRDTYYASAREAFLEHQFIRGPRTRTPDLDRPMAPLHQQLRIHGLPIFVLDERSARDCSVPQVLGAEQTRAFGSWLDELDPSACPHYVVVSPLPILYRLTDAVDLASAFDSEIIDDLVDNWSSDLNVAELDRLLSMMLRAHARGLQAIILSGDMHTSALLSASAQRSGEEADSVFAFEIVASGLATVVGGYDWKHFIAREGTVLPDPIEIDGYSVSFALGYSEPEPNFAGLSFRGTDVRAELFQATAQGIRRTSIPLRWGSGVMNAEAAVEAAAPRSLGPWPFGR